MTLTLKHKIGTGIEPRDFIEEMEENKEIFLKRYNSFEWRNEDKSFFTSLRNKNKLRCFILCTDWCPDVIYNVPIVFRALEHGGIKTEVLVMDKHLETMDLFLIDGGRAQPMVVFTNSDGDVLSTWGPRPQYIQVLMERFRESNTDRKHPDYKKKIDQVYKQMIVLYEDGTNYHNVIVDELHQLLAPLHAK